MNITPYLWFEKSALEAAKFYVSAFENSQIFGTSTLADTPSGHVDMVDFELEDMMFSAIGAGPQFKLNPSISLMVVCDSAESVAKKWRILSQGATVLMPLQAYDFSPSYGWLMDQFGLNWQIMQSPLDADEFSGTHIKISMLFSNDACGRAQDAMDAYVRVFEQSEKGFVNYYGPGEANLPQAKINYGEFVLEGVDFVAMDNGYPSDFDFNEAFSLMITCDTQDEIDYYWHELSAVPDSEQCGWLKDQFGVSWQVVPKVLGDLMATGNAEQVQRVTQAFMSMKKFDIAALERAFKG